MIARPNRHEPNRPDERPRGRRPAKGGQRLAPAPPRSTGPLCRLKAFALTALLAPTGRHAPAFEPFRNGSTSGFKARDRVAALYVDRSRSTLAPGVPDFGYAKALFLAPGETEVAIDAFLDGSILEAFANGGRACATARLYPTRPDATRLAAYNAGAAAATLAAFDATALGSALLGAPPRAN